jgi:hypothetical protein
LEISKFKKKIWSKTCNFGMVRRENPPPPPPCRQHFREKCFRCPFQYFKVPLEVGAPPNILMLPMPLTIPLFPHNFFIALQFILCHNFLKSRILPLFTLASSVSHYQINIPRPANILDASGEYATLAIQPFFVIAPLDSN